MYPQTCGLSTNCAGYKYLLLVCVFFPTQLGSNKTLVVLKVNQIKSIEDEYEAGTFAEELSHSLISRAWLQPDEYPFIQQTFTTTLQMCVVQSEHAVCPKSPTPTCIDVQSERKNAAAEGYGKAIKQVCRCWTSAERH